MGRLLAWSVLLPLPAAASWPTSPLVNLPVCATIDQQAPAGIASDGSGGAFITWGDSRLGAGNADLYVQRVLAAGSVDPAWPLNGQDVCTAPGDQLAPAIVSDGVVPIGGGSGAIVAWQDLRTGTTYDVYAQHVLAGGIADPAWPRNGRAVCTAAGNQENVSLVSDNAGGALVIWRDFRAGTTQAVFAQHVLANGAVDPAWPVNGRLLLTQPNTFDRPTRIPTLADGHGGAIVVWENWNGVATADLAAQHVRANGTLDPAWPAAGRAVSSAINSQLDPCIVADLAGGAIVCWDDARGASVDIYAQHVRADGSLDPAWPADGRLTCGAAGDQVTPAAASDGSGGALVAWADARSGSADIYAQRVLAGGTVAGGWPADGRAVCTATGDQLAPAAAVDGMAGLLLAWVDSRSVDTGPDVFAGHVLASGALDPAWPSGGRAVCAAAGSQSGILALADGAGGAILTWNDQRGGDQNSDVYAQRVQANGVLGGTVVDVPFDGSQALALSLDAVRPNPWHGRALTLSFSLATEEPAMLEVLDIAGRRVAMQELTARGPSRATTKLVLGSPVAPGVYLVRLRQGDRVRLQRFVVLD
jgi:hypothetical protein